MPLGLHGFDLIALLVVALLVFGPKRLPQMGSAIGQTFNAFKRSVNDISGDHQTVMAPQDSQIVTPPATAPVLEEPLVTITHEPVLR